MKHLFSLSLFSLLLSTPLISCECKNCKCDVENHCGCFSDKGCHCEDKDTCCGKK